MYFTIYNTSTGQIRVSGEAPDYDLQVCQNGESKLPLLSRPTEQYIENGELMDMGDPPQWYYTFDYTTKRWIDARTQEEKIIEIQVKRNQLLKESDWTQLPDVPLSTKEQWATYRQALRDITLQQGYPNDVEWPTSPEM